MKNNWNAYSNENFDRVQNLALELTEEDRKAGKEAPLKGYSLKRLEEARRIIRQEVLRKKDE